MTETGPKWTEEMSREFASYMEGNVRHDHRRFAKAIVADGGTAGPGATVLDVAGGPGFLISELAALLPAKGARLLVADDSPTMISVGKERAAKRGDAVEFLACGAEKLELADRSADLVLCKHFLRLAPDAGAALREMARVLRPGGRAYLIDFNPDGPWLATRMLRLWIQLTAPTFIRRMFAATTRAGFPLADLQARLIAAGFASSAVLERGVSYLVRAER